MKNLTIIIFSFFSLIFTISAMSYEVNSSPSECAPILGNGSNSSCSINMKLAYNKPCEKN